MRYPAGVRNKIRSRNCPILAVIVFLLCDQAIAINICDWAQKNYRQKISDEADQRDVSRLIEDVAANCVIPPSEKLSNSEKEKLERRGHRAEAAFQLQAIESAGYYRDVSADLEKYRAEMSKGNASNFIPTQTVSRYEKRGLINKNVGAKDCAPVDLRSRFGEVRDQDSVGWCYAFTAADLIGFKTGITVSAADVAAVYSSEMKTSIWKRFFSREGEVDRQGGDEFFAVDHMRKIGVCKESDFPSEYFAENKDTKNFVEILEKASEKNRVRYLTAGIMPVQTLTSKNYADARCDPFSSFAISQTQLSNIKHVVDRTLPSRAFYDLASKSCEGKRISIDVPNLEFAEFSVNKPIAVTSFMDEKLNLGLPVAISWSTDLAQGRRPARRKPAHASTVVGRRLNPTSKRCEYLIRNSWGKSCAYVRELECEDGNVWVTREMAHQMVERAVSFEK